MTRYPDLFAALAAPFRRDLVRTRKHDGARYVTARTVATRLDEVLGPENWTPEFSPWSEDAVLCRLTIRLPDGSTVTKEDAGGHAGMQDSGDDDKSAHSDALKRAAVLFGVGRYLYGDGAPTYHAAPESPQGEHGHGHGPEPSPAPVSPALPPTRVNGKPHDGPPRSGRALFAWVKDQEQLHDVPLLKHLNAWAKLNEFPGRMVDWDAEQVQRAYDEATRKLARTNGAVVSR